MDTVIAMIFTRLKLKVRFFSIRTKILIISVLCIVIPLTIVGTISSYITANIVKKQVSEANLQTTIQSRENLDFILQELQKSVEKLVVDEEIMGILRETDFEVLSKEDYYAYVKRKNLIGDVFTNFLISRPEISYINLSIKGTEITSKDDVDYILNQLNFYETDNGRIYSAVMNTEGRYIWGSGTKILNKSAYNDLMFYVGVVYDDQNSKELGLLTIAVKKNAIIKRMCKDDDEQYKGLLAVISESELIFPLSDTSKLLNELDIEVLNGQCSDSCKVFEGDLSDGRYLIAFDDSKYSGLRLINILPMGDVVSNVHKIKEITIKTTIVCILFAMLLATLLSNKIIQPLKELTALTSEVEAGQLDLDYEAFNKQKSSKWKKIIDATLGLNGRFRAKLLRYFVNINIIPLIILIFVLYKASIGIVEHDVTYSIRESLKYAGKRLELSIREAEQNSKTLLTNNAIQSALFEYSKNNANLTENSKRTIESVILQQISKEYNMVYAGIYTIDGRTLYSSTNVYFNKKNVLKELWYEKVRDTSGEIVWTDTYRDNLNNHVISNVRKIKRIEKDAYTVGESIGFLLISYDESFLGNTYENIYLGGKQDFYIINDEGKIISNRNKQLLGSKIDQSIMNRINLREGSFTEIIDGRKYLILYSTPAIKNWKIISAIPLDDIIKRNRNIFVYNIYILLISFLMMILISFSLASRLSKPLVNLKKMMVKVENGDFSVDLNTESNDEIEELGKSFIRMVKRLKNLIQEIYEIQASRHEAEINQKEAEMAALQAQINPHFLYNTLETIRMVSLRNNDKKSATMIKLLSDLLRYSIKRGNDVVLIEEEVRHIKKYLQLQNFRFQNKFEVDMDVDEGILGFNTVKLILQPLVENAIYHGIETKEGKCCIKIKGYRDEDLIKFIIEDDGTGIDETELEEIRKNLRTAGREQDKRSIGLKNVSDRIRLYFNLDNGFEIESKKDVGTKVTVSIPINYRCNNTKDMGGTISAQGIVN